MDFDNNVPIYVQVVNKIKQDLATGKIHPGDKMPSTRDFAIDIGLNLNTVARIYKELELEGIVYTKRGLGTFVADDNEKIRTIRLEMANKLLTSFILGMKNTGYTKDEIIDILNQNIDNFFVVKEKSQFTNNQPKLI